MRSRRIIEVNPGRPFFILAACKNAPKSSEEKGVVDLLIATALNSSGFTVVWYLQRESIATLIGRLGLPLYCSSDVSSLLYDHDLERQLSF
ncbi:hypothetical protein L1987_78901 [Smallanthus sonchifolius]|uniref:Uncharacterized protein n=1 Tax=Smallanthus sonchifolius TaxID=185202 RepID=A0ACB8ZDN3_9ASTR|nr:hypothetical protein L1987_78901 [Smallanthus sonchifolius]